MIEHDVVQGTPAWFKLRAGRPTASDFHHIITPKKGELAAARHKYACRLIAERLLNWQAESLEGIRAIQQGKLLEPFAVQQLEFSTGIETRPVGFLTTDDGRFGASPDRMVGMTATVEIKCPTAPRHLEYLLLGHDEAYRCQVQGQLWVAEADKGIFYSYSDRMPPCHGETGRDEAFIRRLVGCLEQFSDELAAMTERALSLGVFQAFEADGNLEPMRVLEEETA